MGEGQEYSQDEFLLVLDRLVRNAGKNERIYPVENPRAVLLGGQSGAGKTTLHKILAERFGKNVVVVNGDEYRSMHPRYHEFHERYGDGWVQHTANWAGNMVEALVDALSDMGYNLVVEGTLRTSQAPMRTAALLRGKGYGVSLALMAVKPEISLLSCQIRYEQMRIAGTILRAVDPAHHKKIVDDIAGNLAVLEESGLFEGVELFSRSEARLYPREGDLSASEVLRGILFGQWSDEDLQQKAFLEGHLARLRSEKGSSRQR